MTQDTLENTLLKEINEIECMKPDQPTVETKWDKRYEDLIRFNLENKHCRVPRTYKENPQLGHWVNLQRSSRSELSEEKIQKLTALNFEWKAFKTWDEMYEELVQYKSENKHCRVPTKNKENPQLGTWVGTQRTYKHKLPKDKIKKLNKIGFDWNLNESIWNEMYRTLVKFKAKNNHCNVPREYVENQKLARWVSTQRKLKDTLSEEKIQKLDNIGFEWVVFDVSWHEMYEKLIQYKLENNDCRVSQMTKLGTWVQTQRTRKNKLTKDKLEKLNALGFDWNLKDTLWNEMFEVLVRYKLENNHCKVPQAYEENLQLGNWVRTQRASKSKLPEFKLNKLNALGFDWRLR